ncbi:unnamed protein product, partial [Timema podura]|nr:unnamed protein product [Timema podura]
KVCSHLHEGRVENYFRKTTLSTPYRDSNLDLPIIGSLVYCESKSTVCLTMRPTMQKVCSRLPHLFTKPNIRGMLEVDWREYLTKERRRVCYFTGDSTLHKEQKRRSNRRLWALRSPVAVFYNDKLIGSDVELLKILQRKYYFSTPEMDSFFEHRITTDYKNYIAKLGRTCVYLKISIEGGLQGVLKFQLYSDLLPDTCQHFKDLCTGDKEGSYTKSYKHTQIHRVCKLGWIQGGG